MGEDGRDKDRGEVRGRRTDALREDRAQPLTRRRFLCIAGVTGLIPVVRGDEGFELAQNRKKVQPKISPGLRPQADLKKAQLLVRNPRFSVLRPDDLLTLEIECLNLAMQPGTPPKLVRMDGDPAYLIVHFPPQHIAEQAFFEATPHFEPDKNDPKKESGGSDDPRDPPVGSRLAGATRLAFLVPKEVAEIPLTLEALLSWESLDPSLVPVALPPSVPAAFAQAAGQGKRKPQAPAPGGPVPYTPAILPGGASARDLYRVRQDGLGLPVNTAILKIAPPAAHQTAIELPYRLLLSPNAYNLWAHSVGAVTHNGRTELWHTRLAAPDADGAIVDSGSPYLAVRAVWSPDCNAGKPSDGPGHDNGYPFRMSLDRQDRHEIVHLTSNFVMNHQGSRWQPKPVEVDRLMLSPLGGWLDSTGTWSDTPLAVQQWDHRATLGRDHYVKVVYRGFLMPFGHAASLVKITERKFHRGDDDRRIAYLFQRMYIVVREAEKVFPAPFQPYEGRELPFRSVRLTTRMTPPLDRPEDSDLLDGAHQSAFWPYVQKRDFLFHCIGADRAGNRVEFTTPMAFVDANYAFQPDKMEDVVEVYNQDANRFRRRPLFRGRKVAFAPPQKTGDTELEVQNITFRARLPLGQVKSDDWKRAGQPLFFPAMDGASVFIPALKSLVRFGAAEIRYPKTYIQNGLGGANRGEVFAAIPAAPGLDFGAGKGDRSGGVATPSFAVIGLSRALGPVGGLPSGGGDAMAAAETALADVSGGRFDPAKFFNDKASLLGGILLRDIVKAVPDFLSRPDEALSIKTEIRNDASGSPVEMHTLMNWKPQLRSSGAFVAERNGSPAALTIDARSIAYLSGKDPAFEIRGELRDFTLDLVKPLVTLIRIKFSKFAFTAKKGQKPVFNPAIAAIEFAGPLNFVKDLLDRIQLPGMDDDGFGQPIVDVDAERARLGYTFNIPDVGFGVFSLQNIDFSAVVTLPFTGDPLLFRFAFNERSNPFLLTVAMFGGGGFFAIELLPDRIRLIEGSLEFGGSFSMNLGVASGGVSLMAGIYFKYEEGDVTISGYVRCRGCLRVLGLISISAEFYLGLTYEEASNRVWGEASLTVKVKVLFFSTKVTLRVERSFRHSPPPLFADIMDEGHWLDYCEAFA